MRLSISRRVFIVTGALALAGVALVNKLTQKKRKEPVMSRFLTHDGKLVEVPINKVPGKKNQISREKLVSWIWKNQSLT